MITLLKALAGGIKAFFLLIAAGAKIVYRILKRLRIRLLTAYLAVCGILQLAFAAFTGRAAWFWAGVAVCMAATAAGWGYALWSKFHRIPPRNGDAGETEAEGPQTPAAEPQGNEGREEAEEPKWYRVAGREGYFFAEYRDRYELYRRLSDGETELVRTDKKEETP